MKFFAIVSFTLIFIPLVMLARGIVSKWLVASALALTVIALKFTRMYIVSSGGIWNMPVLGVHLVFAFLYLAMLIFIGFRLWRRAAVSKPILRSCLISYSIAFILGMALFYTHSPRKTDIIRCRPFFALSFCIFIHQKASSSTNRNTAHKDLVE